MYDQQYLTFLNMVRTFYPQYAHLIAPLQTPTQQTVQGQAQPSPVQNVQEIQFVTRQQADSYIPQSTNPVALWDQDGNLIYLIHKDQVGRSVRETLKWETVQSETPPQTAGTGVQYATAADLAAVNSKLDSLVAALEKRQEVPHE